MSSTTQMIQNKPIMIIEDSQVDILLIKNAFEELDIHNETIIFNNGYDALQKLSSLTSSIDFPGLILLDINMPKMNGLEFLNLIKQNEDLKIIPVIILTTSDSKEDKLESYKNFAAGYLVKPLEYFEFVEMIKSVKNYWYSSKVAY